MKKRVVLALGALAIAAFAVSAYVHSTAGSAANEATKTAAVNEDVFNSGSQNPGADFVQVGDSIKN